jgi:cytoskeletal protein RodZ
LTEEKEKTGDQKAESGEQLELGSEPAEPEQVDLGGEETVGEMLLAAREKKGLTLEAVSQESKIPTTTLQYLETDNFEAIPAKVYATGFLRTYSQILGLDPAQLINKYEVQTGQTHKSRGDLWEIEEEVVEEKLDSPHLLRKFVIPAVLLVVAIIILWKVFGGSDGGEDPGQERPGTQQVVESGGGTDDPDMTTGGTSQDSDPGEDAAEGADVREEQAPARTEPEGMADVTPPGEMTLRIFAEERIWFDLVVYNQTDSGMVELETDFILEAGDSRTFTSNESFFIRKIGKTEGFTIELDGRPYEVPIVEGRLPRDISISRDR